MLSDFGKNDILKVAFFGVSVFPFLVSLSYLIRKCGPGSRSVDCSHRGVGCGEKRNFRGPATASFVCTVPKVISASFGAWTKVGPALVECTALPGGSPGAFHRLFVYEACATSLAGEARRLRGPGMAFFACMNRKVISASLHLVAGMAHLHLVPSHVMTRDALAYQNTAYTALYKNIRRCGI